MKINEILKKCHVNYYVQNIKNFDIKGISFDSKTIEENFIFAVVKGFKDDGEKYIKDLKKFNNIGIIVREGFKTKKDHQDLLIIRTKNVRELAGEIASLIYPNTINEKIAITGTNGKTSISHYIAEISSNQKISNCIFGTLGIIFNNKQISNTNLTTNESIINHKYMNELSKQNCRRVIFEASSIGLEQNRLQNIKFDKIAITNLTIDHLDYHKTFRNYRYCKSLLLRKNYHKNTIVVINADTKESDYFKNISKKNHLKILDYGKKARYFKFLKLIKIKEGFEVYVSINGKDFVITFNCSAIYQVYNQICALLLIYGENFLNKEIKKINLSDPDGRLEKIYDNNNKRIFVDYAHTPDALKNVLYNLSDKIKGRLIIVFGCGGDRDSSKRSLMTKEALKYCDKIYLTSDNPRNESLKKIFEDMKKGILKKNLEGVLTINNRKEAIEKAMDDLKAGDILLVAGKGHENYQIIKNKKIPFSDKKVILDRLSSNE
jgi:murE/murF fusion protein